MQNRRRKTKKENITFTRCFSNQNHHDAVTYAGRRSNRRRRMQ
jgi:hypothetical protein